MEGYFPPEDREKWLTAIEDLVNINKLVQEDIRDMLLSGNDEKFSNFTTFKDEKDINLTISTSNNISNVHASNKKTSNKINSNEHTLTESNRHHGNEKRKERLKSNKNVAKVKNSSRTSSRKTTKVSKNENEKEGKAHRSDSLDSTDKYLLTLPKNKNGLRPPFVWNFPIQRIEEIREKLQTNKEKIENLHRSKNKRVTKKQQKPKLDIAFKEESKKNEIRKVNPFPYYHDGRIERFYNLFNELYTNSMKYSRANGNNWEYVYVKILNVLGIEYTFKPQKEETIEILPTTNATEENKEGEKKEEEKEKKEGEEEKKEEEKKEEVKEGGEGEVKDGEGENKTEVKPEEVKEGEAKENEVKAEESKPNPNEEEQKAN